MPDIAALAGRHARFSRRWRTSSLLGVGLSLASGAACGSAPPAPAAPAHYPALPSAADTGAGKFVADAALQAIQLVCAGSELADNGLDDDCDGAVDGAKPAASKITLTAAYRAETPDEVSLDLTSESGGPVPELGLKAEPGGGPAVRLSRLDLSALPRGRYRLTATRPGAEASATELSLAVSSATNGSTQTYLVRLGAGETRTLGVIEVP
jgi:hypothetical protein